MLKKFQFPVSVAMLVVMVFVWKTVYEKYISRSHSHASLLIYKNADEENEAEAISLTAIGVNGNVRLSNGATKLKVSVGQVITQPWNIETDDESMLQLGYGDGFSSKIKVDQNSNFHLSRFYQKGFKTNEGLVFDIKSGVLLFKLSNLSNKKIVRVRTPHFSMAARGATFVVESNEEKTVLLVHEGLVEVESKSGKGKTIRAGSGLSGKSENDLDQIQVANYHLDWNADNAAPTPPPSTVEINKVESNSMVQAIEEEIVRMTNSLEERRTRNIENTKIIDKKIADVDEELRKLDEDESCLNHMMKGCEFTSTKFKNDVSNLKNNPTNLTRNPAIKINLLKEFSQERVRVEQQKTDLKAELEQDEKDLQKEIDKIAAVRTKLSEIQNADAETKNKGLREIVELIDTKTIREAAQKSGLNKF